MRMIGIDPQKYEIEGRRRLVFIDCYSFLVGVKSKEQYSEDPQRLSDLSIVVSKALSESRDPSNTLLAMDSLTTLLQRSGVRPSFDFLHTLVAELENAFSWEYFDSRVGNPVWSRLIVNGGLAHLLDLDNSQERFSHLQLLQQNHAMR